MGVTLQGCRQFYPPQSEKLNIKMEVSAETQKTVGDHSKESDSNTNLQRRY